MTYLVDTNVLCESSKPEPDDRVLEWLLENDSELAVSSLTLGEMLKGIHLMDAGKRRRALEKWYGRIEKWAVGRILPVDFAVCRTCAILCAKHQRKGCKLPAIDSLIGATAIHHQLTLVTRNTGDFPDDVAILNPWEE